MKFRKASSFQADFDHQVKFQLEQMQEYHDLDPRTAWLAPQVHPGGSHRVYYVRVLNPRATSSRAQIRWCEISFVYSYFVNPLLPIERLIRAPTAEIAWAKQKLEEAAAEAEAHKEKLANAQCQYALASERRERAKETLRKLLDAHTLARKTTT